MKILTKNRTIILSLKLTVSQDELIERINFNSSFIRVYQLPEKSLISENSKIVKFSPWKQSGASVLANVLP